MLGVHSTCCKSCVSTSSTLAATNCCQQLSRSRVLCCCWPRVSAAQSRHQLCLRPAETANRAARKMEGCIEHLQGPPPQALDGASTAVMQLDQGAALKPQQYAQHHFQLTLNNPCSASILLTTMLCTLAGHVPQSMQDDYNRVLLVVRCIALLQRWWQLAAALTPLVAGTGAHAFGHPSLLPASLRVYTDRYFGLQQRQQQHKAAQSLKFCSRFRSC